MRETERGSEGAAHPHVLFRERRVLRAGLCAHAADGRHGGGFEEEAVRGGEVVSAVAASSFINESSLPECMMNCPCKKASS